MRAHFAQTNTYNLQIVDTISLYALIIFCLLLAAHYGFRYLQFRKRVSEIKSRNVVVAEYASPLDMPPAFFDVILDNRTSLQSLPATILWLVFHGYLAMKYHDDKNDFYIKQTGLTPAPGLYEHQRFVLQLFEGQTGLWASTIRINTVDINNKFNFLILKDLQQAGYYYFHKNIDISSYSKYYLSVMTQAFYRGISKPRNWPGFLLVSFFPQFGIIWLIVSLIFYNRVGLYNYRTPEWEKIWPEVAGYYNYLRMVEAEKRSFELRQLSSFKVRQHDPYLVAAQLQQQWSQRFSNTLEIGAGGNEYNTM